MEITLIKEFVCRSNDKFKDGCITFTVNEVTGIVDVNLQCDDKDTGWVEGEISISFDDAISLGESLATIKKNWRA